MNDKDQMTPPQEAPMPNDSELNDMGSDNVQLADKQTDGTIEGQERLAAENAELRDKYLRLMAEFDNSKKRHVRERAELISTAAQSTMTALLDVLDDFDRAKRNADSVGSQETFSEGVNLVYHKLYSVLHARGLEPIDSDGQPFDAEWHEAVTEIPAPTPELVGKIVDTIEKGYTLNGKIIRHAKVVVGK